MSIKVTVKVDEDRWEKRPYHVEFSDPDCQREFGKNYLDSWEACYSVIRKAKAAGYDIDSDYETIYY